VKILSEPVTVIGELIPICHWEIPGKAEKAKIHKPGELPECFNVSLPGLRRYRHNRTDFLCRVLNPARFRTLFICHITAEGG